MACRSEWQACLRQLFYRAQRQHSLHRAQRLLHRNASQGAYIAEVIDCVVGIEDVISDEGARQFATAFYRALGYEKSIGDAFALGQVQLN